MTFNNTILSEELSQHIWELINMRGRLHTLREVSSKLAFLILRDRDGLSQIVLENKEEILKLKWLQTWTILKASGTVQLVPKGKFKYELNNTTITIITPIIHTANIDITREELNIDNTTLQENKVVALRHTKNIQTFKIATHVEKHMRAFLDEDNFTQINTPKLIAFPTEGWSEVFDVGYFDKKRY